MMCKANGSSPAKAVIKREKWQELLAYWWGLNVMVFSVPIDIPIQTLAGELSIPSWNMVLQLAEGSCSPPSPPSAGRGWLGSSWAPGMGTGTGTGTGTGRGTGSTTLRCCRGGRVL